MWSISQLLVYVAAALPAFALGQPAAGSIDFLLRPETKDTSAYAPGASSLPADETVLYGGSQSLNGFIALYALAVDSKNESALAALFDANAIATYTSPDQTVQGNTAIAQHDLYAFDGLHTFHNLVPMTQRLVSGESFNGTLSAITYFTATIFGKDCYAGQIVTAYGQYVDTIEDTNGGLAITRRTQTYANPTDPYIGNIAIVLGPACNSTKSGQVRPIGR